MVSVRSGGAIFGIVDGPDAARRDRRVEGSLRPAQRVRPRRDPPRDRLHHLIDADDLDAQTARPPRRARRRHRSSTVTAGCSPTERSSRSSDSQHEGARTAAANRCRRPLAVLKVSEDGDITVFRAGPADRDDAALRQRPLNVRPGTEPGRRSLSSPSCAASDFVASMNSSIISNTTCAGGFACVHRADDLADEVVGQLLGARARSCRRPGRSGAAPRRRASAAAACRAARASRGCPTRRSTPCAAGGPACRCATASARCRPTWRARNFCFTTGWVSASSVVSHTDPHHTPCGAERHRRGHLTAAADAAGAEHRDVADRVDDLGDEHHRADLTGVPAGLGALGDDDVDAGV